jgi:hypothetical protein
MSAPLKQEFTKARGHVKIHVTDKEGNVKDSRDIKNLIVDVGLEFIVSRMVGTNKDVMSYMAIGSDDTTTNAASFTDLGSTLGVRKALNSIQIVDSGLGIQDSVQYNAAWFAGESTGAVVEAGLFNDSTVGQGDMLARTTFPVVNKGPDDILAIEWTITLEPDVSSSGA